MNNLQIKTLEYCSNVLSSMSLTSLSFANWCQTKSDQLKWYSSKKYMNQQPDLMQWANRLIEYVDKELIVFAFKRFELLVKAGVAPDHAFRLVTQSR